GFAVRVGDYAAAAPAVKMIILVHQAADGDIQVHLPLAADIADAAAIQAAADWLQLLDDLHGADFRCAGDRAAGKCIGQQAQSIVAWRKLAGDAADQVVDVGVAFDAEQLWHPYAAIGADAAQIVAQQIDDHQVLGPI